MQTVLVTLDPYNRVVAGSVESAVAITYPAEGLEYDWEGGWVKVESFTEQVCYPLAIVGLSALGVLMIAGYAAGAVATSVVDKLKNHTGRDRWRVRYDAFWDRDPFSVTSN